MRIIAKKALADFWARHPEAEERLATWFRVLSNCSAKNFSELKRTFQTADYVPKKFTVFDVGGNAYRVVCVIHYNMQTAYIRGVHTHRDYDRWTEENRT